MLGYYEDEEATKEAIEVKKDKDGSTQVMLDI